MFGRHLRRPPEGPFKLAALPYEAKALEPHIDAMTMEIHHGKHHQAYVNNLNTALKDHGELAKLPLEEILAKIGEVPEAVENGGSQQWRRACQPHHVLADHGEARWGRA